MEEGRHPRDHLVAEKGGQDEDVKGGNQCFGGHRGRSTGVQEFRSQESGVRSQESGVRSQESGVRSQESGVRSQESGVRSQESGVRSQESGVRSQEPGVRSQESGVRSQESGVSLNAFWEIILGSKVKLRLRILRRK